MSLKRCFDVAVSAFGLALLAIPLLVVALLVKLSSPGPALFLQERVGRDGIPFWLYKFRTMRLTDRGPSVTADGDPRVTRLGRFLRRWKIDELPQLWNVLRGDMSVIGPRPEAENFVRWYRDFEREVLRQTPGLAGMSALIYPDEGDMLRAHPDPEGAYAEQLMPRKLEVELAYEARRTFASDLGLMLKLTLCILGSRKYADRAFRIDTSTASEAEKVRSVV